MLTEFVKFLQAQSKTGAVNPASSAPLLKPEAMSLTSLEKYHSGRYRERYSMNTASIDAFIAYTNDRADDMGMLGVITSVDPDSCSASAIFNARLSDEEAGHCDDTATCTLKPLPMWRFLMKIGEQDSITETQRGVIDIIRDWHDYIPEASALVGSFTKLNVESMSKHSATEKDFGRERTAMEKIDLKADGAEVPSDIAVNMAPYDGFQSRQVQIGVSALVSRDGAIAVKLRVRGYEALKLLFAEEFAEKLTAGLDVKPIIGTIRAA